MPTTGSFNDQDNTVCEIIKETKNNPVKNIPNEKNEAGGLKKFVALGPLF